MQKFHESFKYILPILVLIGFVISSSVVLAVENREATIYYNEGCHHCVEYINNNLIPILKEYGLQIIKKDFKIGEYGKELYALNEQLGIPPELQGHMTTFIDNKIILEGHVPEHVIRDLLNEENKGKFEKIVVLQDKMHDVRSYKVWAFEGEIKEYAIDTPITEYLDWFQENRDSLVTPPPKPLDLMALLPVVLSTGLLDGINPCAFAVILFLIAFLFTIKKTKAGILKVGVTYILTIYMVYSLIGLGILQVVHIFGVPHFMAIFGAFLVISLGLINLIGYFFPRFPIKLKIPTASKDTIVAWVHKATIPAAFVLGILVGLCVFPCSGAVYVAIIGLLSMYPQATGYLLLYNLMFVMPLVVILFAASNKVVVQKMTEWERSKSRAMHLFSGLIMCALGIIILIWFV